MSYDLYLKQRSGELSKLDFLQFFAHRQNFNVGNAQAGYGNDETGVYFGFEMRDPDPDDTEEFYPIAFNINYFRPSYFILEAEPEVSAFVEQFDLVVLDPQMHGMGEGEYSSSALISGWKYGNEFGYEAVLRDPNNRNNLSSLPSAELTRLWRWNYFRCELQIEVGDSMFVPRIMLVQIDGGSRTVAAWPDGIPVVLPYVDYVVIGRDEFAPRKWLRRQKDHIFVSWNELHPNISNYDARTNPNAVTLNYASVPHDLREYVSHLPPNSLEVVGLSPDSVLDRELVEKYAVNGST